MEKDLSNAIALFNSGKSQEAKVILEKIIQQDPTNGTAWYGLALCLSEPDKVIYCLNRAISINPHDDKAKQLLQNVQNQKSSINKEKNDLPKQVSKENQIERYSQIEVEIRKTQYKIDELLEKKKNLEKGHGRVWLFLLIGSIMALSGVTPLNVIGLALILFCLISVFFLVPREIRENNHQLDEANKKINSLLAEKAAIQINFSLYL